MKHGLLNSKKIVKHDKNSTLFGVTVFSLLFFIRKGLNG